MNWRLLTWKDIAGFLTVAVIAGAMIYVFVGAKPDATDEFWLRPGMELHPHTER